MVNDLSHQLCDSLKRERYGYNVVISDQDTIISLKYLEFGHRPSPVGVSSVPAMTIQTPKTIRQQ